MPNLPERNLDVLRAVAVLCVFVDHLADPFTNTVGPFSAWELGRLGVLMFFVHTSTVLMASLSRLQQGGRSGWALAKTFYVRRG